MVRILKSLIFFSFVFLLISCSDDIPKIVEDSPKVEAEKYFPLNIGDKFVYNWQRANYCIDVLAWENILYKKHMEVIKDTLIESKEYFVVKSYQDIYEWEYYGDDSSFHYKDTSIITNLSTEYYRVSDKGVLHKKEEWSNSIYSISSFDLAATEIDSIYSEYPNYDIYNDMEEDYDKFFGLQELSTDTVFGKVLDKKVYMRTDFATFRDKVTFTKGLGLVSRDNNFCGTKGGDLEEAYIDGIKYSE